MHINAQQATSPNTSDTGVQQTGCKGGARNSVPQRLSSTTKHRMEWQVSIADKLEQREDIESDARADAKEKLSRELLSACLRGDADKLMGIETYQKYMGHDFNGKAVYVLADMSLCELLGYGEDAGKIAVKALILCAKKGDVDAVAGINQLINNYFETR
jgi:hypothetical protein